MPVCISVFLLKPTKCVKTFHRGPGFFLKNVEIVQSMGPMLSKEEILWLKKDKLPLFSLLKGTAFSIWP